MLGACSRFPEQTSASLKRLEQVAQDEQLYEVQFRHGVDSIRQRIATAKTDSMKWEHMYRLSMKFLHYDIDSASYYVRKKAMFSRTREQEVLDEIQRLHFICYRGQHTFAIEEFRKIDTTSFGNRVQYRYLIADIGFHRHFDEDEEYLYDVARLIKMYPKSNYGTRMRAERLVRNGRYAEAIELADSRINTKDKNLYANLAEILSDAYGALGDKNQQYYWLAESVAMHMKMCDRWHYSIQKLSSLYLEDGDYEKAYFYITRMNDDSQKGHYYNAMQVSYKFKDVVNEVLLESENRRRVSFEVTMSLLAVLFILSIVITINTVRFNRKVRRLNSQLKLRNDELFQANRIRDTYLFRYMLLSSEYIGRLAENRKHLKQILKKDGTDGVVAYLKAPNYDTEEYQLFFTEFDQAFINLFPDFVKNVNLILKEDCRIPQESFRPPLSMELRILALLKLGMKSSSDISVFLNCALSSVYSVRSRSTANSIYPKKEFEEKIGNC